MSMHSVNSILVAGQSLAEQSLDGHREAVQNAFREVLGTVCLQSQKVGSSLRLLTGTETPLDQDAAEVAVALKIPLHLVSSGLPHSLSLSQSKAERQVWLGAEVVDAECQKVRNQIALGFSNSLLICPSSNGLSQMG